MRQNNQTLKDKVEKLNRECPLVLHVNADRLFSTVKRMKMERELKIPINLRTGFVVSTSTGNHANEMGEQEWEDFYGVLTEQLKRDCLELYKRAFN